MIWSRASRSSGCSCWRPAATNVRGTGGGHRRRCTAAGSGGGSSAGAATPTSRPSSPATSGTVTAQVVAADADLIGGPNAQGKVGDYLLENEQVQRRHAGPGAALRAAARTAAPSSTRTWCARGPGARPVRRGRPALQLRPHREARHFEVLADGSDGKAAIVAATGDDAAQRLPLAFATKLARVAGRGAGWPTRTSRCPCASPTTSSSTPASSGCATSPRFCNTSATDDGRRSRSAT